MLKSVIAVLLGLFLVFGGTTYAKTARRTSATKARAAVKPASKSSTSAKRTPRKSSRRTASKKKSRSRQTVARRPVQQVPTPERYTEIQQALADKGYYAGPVNGTWSADSVDALKRFQRDQHLSENGKLDSLTIIALGLGPKRNVSARAIAEPRATEDDHRRSEGSERP